MAYYILTRFLIRCNGADSKVARAVGRDTKGILSVVIYAAAIGLAFIEPWTSIALYVAVALIWFIPDRRIEARMRE
jgi:uncharacterized membrane protein